MKLFAMLDVLIHIFHDVFGKWRSKKAAMAESAMAKLGRALAPGDDLAAFEMFADFVVELIVAGHIAVDDFAVVEDGFDFLRGGLGAESERVEWSAAGVAGKFFASEKTGAERGAGVSGDGLDVDIFEAAAQFKRADKEDVEEDATCETERIGGSGFAKIIGDGDYEFFEIVLRAARDICADVSVEIRARLGQTRLAEKTRGENAAAIGPGIEIAAIQNGQAFCVERKNFAEGAEKFRLAVFAEPLQLVLIAIWAKTEIVSEPGIKPANGIRESKIAKGFDAVAVAEGNRSCTSHRAFIESQNESTVEAGSVVGAGGVGEMVIEAKNVAVAGEQVTELLERSNGQRIFLRAGRRKIGDGDGSEVGRFRLKVVENARHGETRNVTGFLKASEFRFFEGGEDGVIVKKSGGGIAAELGEGEDAHYAKNIMRTRSRAAELRQPLRARNDLLRRQSGHRQIGLPEEVREFGTGGSWKREPESTEHRAIFRGD